MTAAPASTARRSRVGVLILQVLALVTAAAAAVFGIVRAATILMGDSLTLSYPVTVAVPREELLRVPGMSIDSADFSEVTIAVSGVGPVGRMLLAVSALLAAAGIAAIALAVVMLCRRVLNAAPVMQAAPTTLVTVATALLVGVGGSQVLLAGAAWSVSEHWDGHPLFGSSGGLDAAPAALALWATPALVAAVLYVVSGVLRYAGRRDLAAR